METSVNVPRVEVGSHLGGVAVGRKTRDGERETKDKESEGVKCELLSCELHS